MGPAPGVYPGAHLVLIAKRNDSGIRRNTESESLTASPARLPDEFYLDVAGPLDGILTPKLSLMNAVPLRIRSLPRADRYARRYNPPLIH